MLSLTNGKTTLSRLRNSRLHPQSQAEIGRGFAMAGQAKRADVVEVALSSALGNRQDVVRVPERPPCLNSLEPPQSERLSPGLTAAALEGRVRGDGVSTAGRADAAITRKDLIAQISRVRPQPPLMHAVIRAERTAAAREDLHLTPPAERQTIRSQRQGCALRVTSFREDSRGQRGHR